MPTADQARKVINGVFSALPKVSFVEINFSWAKPCVKWRHPPVEVADFGHLLGFVQILRQF